MLPAAHLLLNKTMYGKNQKLECWSDTVQRRITRKPTANTQHEHVLVWHCWRRLLRSGHLLLNKRMHSKITKLQKIKKIEKIKIMINLSLSSLTLENMKDEKNKFKFCSPVHPLRIYFYNEVRFLQIWIKYHLISRKIWFCTIFDLCMLIKWAETWISCKVSK